MQKNKMNKLTPCICNGMNQECSLCGGSGFVNDDDIEIIKAVASPQAEKKQKEELDEYLHPKEEESSVVNRNGTRRARPKKVKKTKRTTLAELNDDNHLQFIGPNNPNRKKLGDTRKFAKKKVKGTGKKKPPRKKK